MQINGQQIDIEEQITISDLLKIQNYNEDVVAVEKNGEIVPRKYFNTEILSNEDKIEIVCFVGGG